MAVVAVRAASSRDDSPAAPGALSSLLRRTSEAPGRETRRFRPIRRPRDLPQGDAIPMQSCIVLRNGAVCLR